jgi:hypothetical protein
MQLISSSACVDGAAHTYSASDENVLLGVADTSALALPDADLASIVRAGATALPMKLQKEPAPVSAAWRGLAVGMSSANHGCPP